MPNLLIPLSTKPTNSEVKSLPHILFSANSTNPAAGLLAAGNACPEYVLLFRSGNYIADFLASHEDELRKREARYVLMSEAKADPEIVFRLPVMDRLLHVVLISQVRPGLYEVFRKPAVRCPEEKIEPVDVYTMDKGFRFGSNLFSSTLLADLSCKHFKVQKWSL